MIAPKQDNLSEPVQPIEPDICVALFELITSDSEIQEKLNREEIDSKEVINQCFDI